MAYDWPATEGLVALARKHGLTEAARRLGVGRTTLREHLDREGVSPDQYRPVQKLAPEGLQEIAELLKGDK